MELIDKAAVVAEIKKHLENINNGISYAQSGVNSGLEEYKKDLNAWQQCQCMCKQILSFLDTLEVKKLNLEKESELIANGIMISVQANKYGTNIYNTKRNDFNHYHLQMAARKGIELGLKTQKGE